MTLSTMTLVTLSQRARIVKHPIDDFQQLATDFATAASGSCARFTLYEDLRKRLKQ